LSVKKAGHPQISRMTRTITGSAGILPACFFGLKAAGRMPALPVSAFSL
jgi:hypothetical protein